jgi:hypothetical protein
MSLPRMRSSSRVKMVGRFLWAWFAVCETFQALLLQLRPPGLSAPTCPSVIETDTSLVTPSLLSIETTRMEFTHCGEVGGEPFAVSCLTLAAMTSLLACSSPSGRVHLGRNWSRSVTIKQDHKLIVTSHYAIARHPSTPAFRPAFFGQRGATYKSRTNLRAHFALGR